MFRMRTVRSTASKRPNHESSYESYHTSDMAGATAHYQIFFVDTLYCPFNPNTRDLNQLLDNAGINAADEKLEYRLGIVILSCASSLVLRACASFIPADTS